MLLDRFNLKYYPVISTEEFLKLFFEPIFNKAEKESHGVGIEYEGQNVPILWPSIIDFQNEFASWIARAVLNGELKAEGDIKNSFESLIFRTEDAFRWINEKEVIGELERDYLQNCSLHPRLKEIADSFRGGEKEVKKVDIKKNKSKRGRKEIELPKKFYEVAQRLFHQEGFKKNELPFQEELIDTFAEGKGYLGEQATVKTYKKLIGISHEKILRAGTKAANDYDAKKDSEKYIKNKRKL